MSLDPLVKNPKILIDAAISKILYFSDISCRQGILAMIPALDKKALVDRNNLFEYGIALVCNGTDAADIEDVLKNIQKIKEQSYTADVTDTLFVIGVLGIQAGLSSNALIQRLDSRIPELGRSDWLKDRVIEINLEYVNEEYFPRVYLHPEETTTEFEKLVTLSDKQIQKIMREVDTETLVWAVLENEKMKNVFYHNMSNAAVELMENDIKDIQENKTIKAKKKIVVIAEKLKFI